MSCAYVGHRSVSHDQCCVVDNHVSVEDNGKIDSYSCNCPICDLFQAYRRVVVA